MVNFIDSKERKIAEEFLKNGYVIRKIHDEKALTWIKKLFHKIILKKCKLPSSLISRSAYIQGKLSFTCQLLERAQIPLICN